MRHALLLLVVLFAGCDSKAKASDPGRSDGKSKEYETCGTTAHCDGDLRCFDGACRRTARSTVGDYFVAVGADQTRAGHAGEAAIALQQAVGHYESEKIALPPDVDCAYGAALAHDPASKDHFELAARVLHRCILALPPGTSIRDKALTALAGLRDAGLNPLSLGGAKLADVYMNGVSSAPAPAAPMGVTITAAPQPTAKSFSVVMDALQTPDVKSGLVACAQTYLANSKKDALVGVVSVKASYIASQYDDEEGRFAIAVEPPAVMPAGTPEASADACVHSVADPAIKGVSGVRDNFATKLTITVK
jgi:hypothetical protein